MLKRYIWLAVAVVFFAFQSFVGSAAAAELSESVRTLPLNDAGETITLTSKEVEQGKRLFNNKCSVCHKGGETKTDYNLDLGTETLAGANPRRDTIEGLVDYMKNPTTYDGAEEIYEFHPSIRSADTYSRMRNLTDEDLKAIAAHILIQPKINPELWAGGKARN